MPYILEDAISSETERAKVQGVFEKIRATDKRRFWMFKRTCDVILAAFARLLFFIPMLVIYLCIFLSDGHNPMFKQERIGRHGKPFLMYKFRTMVPNAAQMLDSILQDNEMDGPVFKIKDDKRITKFGKFLRKTGLDELPQFINVIRGDMSLIGPRPPLRREVDQYTEYHKIRLIVTPGITCLWQVHPQRNAVSFEDWVNMDIDYIINRNVLMDIKIALQTVGVMLREEGQ